LTGADLLIDSDLPSGAGLSSSAALEVATWLAFSAMSGVIWDTHMAAVACRRAENEFVGVASGIMDQFASAASRAGHAMLLDCRSLKTDFIAMPASGTVVVMDTGVRRTLGSSAYNDRRAACERVGAYFRATDPAVRALRDVTEEQLDHAQRKLDRSDFHRAWHVVAENHRVQLVAQAFREAQPRHVGAALNVSHDSLRELYDVSCDELDVAVETARDHPSCFGARMTGAGFGGCAIAYVAAGAAERFVADISPLLTQRISQATRVFACQPGEGARLVR
jgi:galactokinase